MHVGYAEYRACSPLAGLHIQVGLVELLVVQTVSAAFGMCFLRPVIVEVAVTHGALVGGMRELGIVRHSAHKLLTCSRYEKNWVTHAEILSGCVSERERERECVLVSYQLALFPMPLLGSPLPLLSLPPSLHPHPLPVQELALQGGTL